ncbi:PH domain-containing protein [Actinomadura sp. WAC 06369]|uniref:PH domain-containing protein n=1 Tax=Actinomadura sp. WAC 06369 TaxID=2203193 RepID=UPI000F7763FD|nr:PH domain-containing protein [Actinomadura sp. WAC 06369]RSN60298.1 hypothetical protein DMH08_21060 [Actinomadura sp. WAC 06369]
MRRTYRSRPFRVVGAVIVEGLVFLVVGGIGADPLAEDPAFVLALLALSAGQVPVFRAARCRVVVTDEGIRHHAFFLTRRYPWADVTGVEIAAAGQAPLPADCPAVRLKGRALPVNLYALTCYTWPDSDGPARKVVRAVEEIERLRRARLPDPDDAAR